LAAAAVGPLLSGGWHLNHYAARAAANERALVAEFLAAPLCTGSTPRKAGNTTRKE
jgi:hypothetical protein